MFTSVLRSIAIKCRPGENGGGGLFCPPLFAILFNLVDPDRYIPAACFSIVHGLPSLHYLYVVLYFLATLIHIVHILLVLSSLAVPAPSSSAPAMKGTPVQILEPICHIDQAIYLWSWLVSKQQ